MKQISLFFLFLTVVLISCPVPSPVNKHSIARIKEKSNCNIELVNQSSYTVQFKYAPVPYRKDIEKNIPFYGDYCTAVSEKLIDMGYRGGFLKYFIGEPYFLNVYGTIEPNGKVVLYTGVDGGTYINHPSNQYPNVNVDGLPSRFVLMIDGETICYSLVYDCPKSSGTHELVLTDTIINRLKTFNDNEFALGYNGKREWYGESIKIHDRLYCFERLDIKKSSLIDYKKVEYDFKIPFNFLRSQGMYGKIYFYTNVDDSDSSKEVLVYYNNDEQKFYYVSEEVNPKVGVIEYK